MDRYVPGKAHPDKNKKDTVEDTSKILQTEDEIKKLDESFAATDGTAPIDLSDICHVLDRRVNWSAVEIFYHSQTNTRYEMVNKTPVPKRLIIRMAHPAINH